MTRIRRLSDTRRIRVRQGRAAIAVLATMMVAGCAPVVPAAPTATTRESPGSAGGAVVGAEERGFGARTLEAAVTWTDGGRAIVVDGLFEDLCVGLVREVKIADSVVTAVVEPHPLADCVGGVTRSLITIPLPSQTDRGDGVTLMLDGALTGTPPIAHAAYDGPSVDDGALSAAWMGDDLYLTDHAVDVGCASPIAIVEVVAGSLRMTRAVTAVGQFCDGAAPATTVRVPLADDIRVNRTSPIHIVEPDGAEVELTPFVPTLREVTRLPDTVDGWGVAESTPVRAVWMSGSEGLVTAGIGGFTVDGLAVCGGRGDVTATDGRGVTVTVTGGSACGSGAVGQVFVPITDLSVLGAELAVRVTGATDTTVTLPAMTDEPVDAGWGSTVAMTWIDAGRLAVVAFGIGADACVPEVTSVRVTEDGGRAFIDARSTGSAELCSGGIEPSWWATAIQTRGLAPDTEVVLEGFDAHGMAAIATPGP